MSKKELSHTPGPWEAEKHSKGYRSYWHIYDRAFSRYICDVGGETGDQEEGNARLIASAPDLLEALEEIVSLPGFKAEEEYRRRALAAIRKARGLQE